MIYNELIASFNRFRVRKFKTEIQALLFVNKLIHTELTQLIVAELKRRSEQQTSSIKKHTDRQIKISSTTDVKIDPGASSRLRNIHMMYHALGREMVEERKELAVITALTGDWITRASWDDEAVGKGLGNRCTAIL